MPAFNLIRHAIDVQNAGGEWKALLETCLKKWDCDDVVSFSTAFRILADGATIDLLYATPLEQSHTYRQTFDALTLAAPREGEGYWPWTILRERRRDSTPAGLFPPAVIDISADGELCASCADSEFSKAVPYRLPFRPAQASDLFDEYRAGGQNKTFHEQFREDKEYKKSWLWYAAAPAILADHIRHETTENAKATRHILYILGTRPEFVGRWADDYGLIVGFAEIAAGRLLEVVDSVVASWQLLAVAPHVREYENYLEALGDVAHGLKTRIGFVTKPRLREIIPDRFSDVEPIIDNLAEPIHLMRFLASEGLARGKDEIKPEDVSSDYNLFEFIEKRVGQYPWEGATDCRVVITGHDQNGPWVNQSYLDIVLEELLTNAKQRKAEYVRVLCRMDDSGARITFWNDRWDESPAGGAGRRHAISGLGLVERFCRCIGGKNVERPTEQTRWLDIHPKTEGVPNDKTGFAIEISYDLVKWRAAVKPITPAAEHVGDEARPAPEPLSPPPQEIAFRVLVLDDEAATMTQREDRLSIRLQELRRIFTGLDVKLSRLTFERREGGGGSAPDDLATQQYYAISVRDRSYPALEIVFCDSVFGAAEYLAHVDDFDIRILDIDFSKDPLRGPKKLPPTMGGIWFSMSHALEPWPCVDLVVTAKEDYLRQSPDYTYLRRLQDLGVLSLHIKKEEAGVKELVPTLQEAFFHWCRKILPVRAADIWTFRALWTGVSPEQAPTGEVLRLKGTSGRDDRFSPARWENSVELPMSYVRPLLRSLTKEEATRLEHDLALLCGPYTIAHYVFADLTHRDQSSRLYAWANGRAAPPSWAKKDVGLQDILDQTAAVFGVCLEEWRKELRNRLTSDGAPLSPCAKRMFRINLVGGHNEHYFAPDFPAASFRSLYGLFLDADAIESALYEALAKLVNDDTDFPKPLWVRETPLNGGRIFWFSGSRGSCKEIPTSNRGTHPEVFDATSQFTSWVILAVATADGKSRRVLHDGVDVTNTETTSRFDASIEQLNAEKGVLHVGLVCLEYKRKVPTD